MLKRSCLNRNKQWLKHQVLCFTAFVAVRKAKNWSSFSSLHHQPKTTHLKTNLSDIYFPIKILYCFNSKRSLCDAFKCYFLNFRTSLLDTLHNTSRYGIYTMYQGWKRPTPCWYSSADVSSLSASPVSVAPVPVALSPTLTPTPAVVSSVAVPAVAISASSPFVVIIIVIRSSRTYRCGDVQCTRVGATTTVAWLQSSERLTTKHFKTQPSEVFPLERMNSQVPCNDRLWERVLLLTVPVLIPRKRLKHSLLLDVASK